MLHNSNYYNNYNPYSMYFKPAPFNSNVEEKIVDKNIEENPNNFDTINNILQEPEVETESSNKNRLSLFGFSLNIDDIIIIAIVIFLFMENKKDYLLLIILGLMFFDVSIDTFKNMSIVKQLFNPT